MENLWSEEFILGSGFKKGRMLLLMMAFTKSVKSKISAKVDLPLNIWKGEKK
jgi:hypothetical protein